MKVSLVSMGSVQAIPIRALEACLVEAGVETTSVFYKDAVRNDMRPFTAQQLETMAELILGDAPNLIGISLRSTLYGHAVQLTRHLKQITDTPVIWGGTHAIVCPEACIEHADIVCMGEGERTIVDVCRRLDEQASLDGVPNILYRQGERVVDNGVGPLIEDLDSLPIPLFGHREHARKIYFDGLKTFCEDPLLLTKAPQYVFLSARGCPFSCAFCSNSFLKDHFKGKGAFIRTRSVGHVMRELRAAKESLPHLRSFSANDEIFGMKDDWLGEFCGAYAKHIAMPFHCDMHPTYVRDHRIKRLKGIGMSTMSLGVQNVSHEIRTARYGRNTPDKMLLGAVDILRDNGIRFSMDLIFDDPLMRVDELHRALEWVMERPRPFRLNLYSMQFHPRTEYTDRMLREGRIREGDVDGVSRKGLTEWLVSHRTVRRSREEDAVLKLLELHNVAFFEKATADDYRQVGIPTSVIRLLYGLVRDRRLRFLGYMLTSVVFFLTIRLRRILGGVTTLRRLRWVARGARGLAHRPGRALGKAPEKVRRMGQPAASGAG